MILIGDINDHCPIIELLLMPPYTIPLYLAYSLRILLKRLIMARSRRMLLLISVVLALFACRVDHHTKHLTNLPDFADLKSLILYTLFFISMLSAVIFLNQKLDSFWKRPKQRLKDQAGL